MFPRDFIVLARQTVRRRRAVSFQLRQRATLALRLHERPFLSNVQAGQLAGIHPDSVRHWRRRWAAGDFSFDDEPGRGRKPRFPPLDQAVVKATACEVVAQTGQPLSRQSLADLTTRARADLGKPISRSTVWRILHADALKPWQYEYWIFPRDPQFAEKAGPILDLYAGFWRGQPLGSKDHILSADEKTSIQARVRLQHPAAYSPPPGLWGLTTRRCLGRRTR
jgi:hypothetical protein